MKNIFKKNSKKILIFLVIIIGGFSGLPVKFFSEIFYFQRPVFLSFNANSGAYFLNELSNKLSIESARAATAGDGKFFYSVTGNTAPQTRDYVSASNSFNTATATVAGAVAIQSRLIALPTKDEFIAGYVNSAGTLQIMCFDGSSWSNEWSVSVGGTATTRRFDIAYETNTGDVMVSYSSNSATTNALSYRTKLGSSSCGSANWSAGIAFPTTTSVTTGTVHWVKIANDRRSASNLLTAIWADSNADLGTAVWDGAVWTNFKSLEISLEVVATAQDVENFDVAYESISGDVLVAWANSAGDNGTNGVRFNTCTGGTANCTWQATAQTPPTFTDDATHLDISANPYSDEIVFASTGNAGNDLQLGYWSGTDWTNTANADTSCSTPLAGTKFVATGWLRSGATTRSVITYYDTGSNNLDWFIGNGSVFTVQTDSTVFTPSLGTQKNHIIEMDPLGSDKLMFLVNNSASDIFAKRLLMSSTGTFTWTNADAGVALELNTGSTVYKTFDFAFNRFNNPPTLLISQPATGNVNINQGNNFNITYSLADPDNVVSATFYYDNNNSGLDGTAITGACSTAPEGTGSSCTWNTVGVPAGTYYIYGISSDGINSQVGAYSLGTITIFAGSLTVDMVNSGGSSIANPSIAFTNKNYSWTPQQSSGTLGTTNQKIRVSNTTANVVWSLSIAPTGGATALWTSSGNNYDFNGTALAGRLQVDPSAFTITPQSGCSSTGLTKGVVNYFSQGTMDVINLVSAGSSAESNCFWDLTGAILTQDIPASQATGAYTLDMTLTLN